MYITGIDQAVLELLSFKVGSGNHQRGISLLQKFSEIFGKYEVRFTENDVTSVTISKYYYNNNVHFEGVRFICGPHLAIIGPSEARADLMAR